MNNNSRPLVVLYGFRNGKNGLDFVGRPGIISLSGSAQKIDHLLRLCNGLRNVREIAEELPQIGSDEILELLNACEGCGIVRDSRELYLGFHEDSSNPMNFSRDISAEDAALLANVGRLSEREGEAVELPLPVSSPFLDILRRRRSVRHFKAEQIPVGVMSGLLRAVYGVGEDGHWSVPSGGALYPLDIYVIIPCGGQAVGQGIYRWQSERGMITRLSEETPAVWLGKTFDASSLLENAGAIICLAANLRRTAEKYANRGYRLALLEAGHAAQNAYLFCAEHGLGAVEYGGFSDEVLARKLGLDFPGEAVLITLVIGTPDEERAGRKTDDQRMVECAKHLKHALVGEGKSIAEVSFMEFRMGNYDMPEWAATAVYRTSSGRVSAAEKGRNRSFGTGTTSHEAVVKVLAEGYERYALEQRRSDRHDCAQNLSGPFVDPSRAVPFAEVQRDTLSWLEPFDPGKKVDWVLGVRKSSGEPVWVPSDLVYYARDSGDGRKPFYQASSSGVAAHFDLSTAVNTALYELIERDAFSVMWYAKRPVRAISHRHFSSAMQYRMSRLEKLGYRVTILDLTLDSLPVVLALIWSRGKTPAMSSGASCRPVFLDAAERAFSEAEFMAMSWHRRRPRQGMKAGDVRGPADHGLFYLDPQNIVHAEWLLEPEECEAVPPNFRGVLPDFDSVIVDITPANLECGLKVARVVAEGLLPINFGYGTEHYGHPRLGTLGYEQSVEYPSVPHFFA